MSVSLSSSLQCQNHTVLRIVVVGAILTVLAIALGVIGDSVVEVSRVGASPARPGYLPSISLAKAPYLVWVYPKPPASHTPDTHELSKRVEELHRTHKRA